MILNVIFFLLWFVNYNILSYLFDRHSLSARIEASQLSLLVNLFYILKFLLFNYVVTKPWYYFFLLCLSINILSSFESNIYAKVW